MVAAGARTRPLRYCVIRVLRNSRTEFRLLSLPAPHATLLLPLSQDFSTLYDIDEFRCCVAEISDNLAGCKRVIYLNVKILR